MADISTIEEDVVIFGAETTTSTTTKEGIYPVRVWELDSNSTRYDKLVAAPSDETLQIQWLLWAIITAIVTIFTGTLLLSIVTHKKNRKEPFNLYLIYLIIPDFIFSLFCGLTCLLNYIYGVYWSEAMCKFQAMYCIFGIGSNAWLNAVVTYELHKMLKHVKLRTTSNLLERYVPPSEQVITFQAFAVYFYTFVLGLATAMPFIPVNERLLSGLACLPSDYNLGSSLVFYLIFLPLFAVIPVLYVTYTAYDIYRKDLLPKTGRSRLQAFFFGRLVVAYLIFWIPSVLFIFILSPFTNQWIGWFSGSWSHLQGLVSAIVSLMKPDLAKGYRNFMCCKFNNVDDDELENTVSSTRNTGRNNGGQVIECCDMEAANPNYKTQAMSSSRSLKSNKAYPGIGGRRGTLERIGNNSGEEEEEEEDNNDALTRRLKRREKMLNRSSSKFKRIEPTGSIRNGSSRGSSCRRDSSNATSVGSTTSLLNTLTIICSINEGSAKGFTAAQRQQEVGGEESQGGSDDGQDDESSSLTSSEENDELLKEVAEETPATSTRPLEIPTGEHLPQQQVETEVAATSHIPMVTRTNFWRTREVGESSIIIGQTQQQQQQKAKAESTNYWRARDQVDNSISIQQEHVTSRPPQNIFWPSRSSTREVGLEGSTNTGQLA